MKTFIRKTVAAIPVVYLGLVLAAPVPAVSSDVLIVADVAEKYERSDAKIVIDDSVITAKVKAALLADDTVKGTAISVETNKGEVQLSGFVSNQQQRDRALEIARSVEGVQKVSNKMSVKSTKG